MLKVVFGIPAGGFIAYFGVYFPQMFWLAFFPEPGPSFFFLLYLLCYAVVGPLLVMDLCFLGL